MSDMAFQFDYKQEAERLSAENAVLRAELEVAESALLRKGYRKTCDIAACNCGSQWNHGGHAEQRLSEISEALRGAGFNGGTLLGNIETVCAERDALRADAERYRWLRSQHEVDDERASDNNYGKSYPPRTMTVFGDDGHDGLDPLPCDPGALDAAINTAKEQR